MSSELELDQAAELADAEALIEELRERTRLLCESLSKVDAAGLSPARVLPELLTIFRETTGWQIPTLPFGLFRG